MNDTSQFEYSLAAAVCLDPKRVLQLRQIVKNEDFSIPACAAVFDAAAREYSNPTLPQMVSGTWWTIHENSSPSAST